MNVESCTKCPLHKLMPDACFPVPRNGPENASIMLVGEALGKDEAIMQEPFIGLCGRFLNKMLKQAGLKRNELCITNTVKCNPRVGNKNRPPTQEEIDSCKSWLWDDIKTVKPDKIVTFGKVPTYTLLKGQLKKSFKLTDVAGVEHTVDYTDAVIIPCYHPSYLLQHGRKKVDEAIDILRSIKC